MIRIAVAVATSDAMPDAFVVWRGVEESIEKAGALGYDGIELALKTADEVDAGEIKKLLSERGMECPCVSTGQVFAGLGLYFTTRDRAKRAEVVRVFKGMIDLASELAMSGRGAPPPPHPPVSTTDRTRSIPAMTSAKPPYRGADTYQAMVNVGRARGYVDEGETREEAETRFIETARELASYAEPKGVRLVLEPVNRYEINFVNSVADGADLLEKVGAPNFALMPDLFHMNIEDPSLGSELERHVEHVAYIHFADSNRLAPGQGHTDFRAIFDSLGRMNYDGWISVEILPEPGPDTAARQAIEYLAPFREEFQGGVQPCLTSRR